MQEIYDFFKKTGHLRQTWRFDSVPSLDKEDSTASHSYRLALMAMILAPEHLDKLKCIKLALAHDLPETLNGDIDVHKIFIGEVSREEKREGEVKAMKTLTKDLPDDMKKELNDLWQEYEDEETPEARFVTALDKIEGMMTLCDGGVVDEPELEGNYGNNTVQRASETKELAKCMKKELKEVFAKNGKEWKKEYDV